MDNPLSFLDAPSADPVPVAEAPVETTVEAPAQAVVEPVAEPVAEPTAETVPADPVDGRLRGPDGKFVAAEPRPDPAPSVEKGDVPISALLDERERRQKAERETEQLQERLRSLSPQVESPAIDDETANQIRIATLNTRLDISEDMARQRHGEEMIDQVQAWTKERMAASPAYANEVLSSRNPYEKAVQDYQRDQVVQSLKPGDLEQFRAWQAAQAVGAQPPADPAAPLAPVAAAPPTPPPTPPRSIASAPSAGGAQAVPTGPGQAYDAVFTKG